MAESEREKERWGRDIKICCFLSFRSQLFLVIFIYAFRSVGTCLCENAWQRRVHRFVRIRIISIESSEWTSHSVSRHGFTVTKMLKRVGIRCVRRSTKTTATVASTDDGEWVIRTTCARARAYTQRHNVRSQDVCHGAFYSCTRRIQFASRI